MKRASYKTGRITKTRSLCLSQRMHLPSNLSDAYPYLSPDIIIESLYIHFNIESSIRLTSTTELCK